MLPVFRYVDDFFAPERQAPYPDSQRLCHVSFDACRLGLMEHAMHCFARLIRAVLGKSSIADRKVECGKKLVILGVEVSILLINSRPSCGISLQVAPGKEAVEFRVNPEKAADWAECVKSALISKLLPSGALSASLHQS